MLSIYLDNDVSYLLCHCYVYAHLVNINVSVVGHELECTTTMSLALSNLELLFGAL